MKAKVLKIIGYFANTYYLHIVACIVVIAVFVLALSINSKVEAVEECDELCEYSRKLEQQKALALDLKAINNEVAKARDAYKAQLLHYQEVKKKYKDLQNEITGQFENENTSDDIAKVAYQVAFLEFLDYEIPSYDPNATGLVIFNPGTSERKQKLMNIAGQLGGEDFVLMLHGENNKRDHLRQSDCY